MNIKYFAACYYADNETNAKLVYPILYKLAPKELLENPYLSSNFISSIWFNLSAKERIALASRDLNATDLTLILEKEEKISVLKALVNNQKINEAQAMKLIALENESLLEKIYERTDSKEIKKLVSNRLNNLTFVKESLNDKDNINPLELENLISIFDRLNPSKELNLFIGFYLHKFSNFKEVITSLSLDSRLLAVYVGSPYLTPKSSEEIVDKMKIENKLTNKYFLMALVANPRTSHKALKEVKEILSSGEDLYEVKQLIEQSLLKPVVEIDYKEISDLEVFKRIIKRARCSEFKPGGRILDLLLLSENKSLPSECKDEVLKELTTSANFNNVSYDPLKPYLFNPTDESLVMDYSTEVEVVADPRYLEFNLSKIGTHAGKEISSLLNQNFGSCEKTWSTALMILDQYDGTLAEFINTSKNI